MSLRIVEGFKFTRMDSPIHRMDPRAKFILTLGFFTTSLMFTNIYALLIIFLTQSPLIILAKTWKRWLRSMRGGLFLGIFIFIMNFIFGTSLALSIAFTLRFFVIMSAFSFFFMTTSADDLGLALDQIHVPYVISFTFTTAVRLVPTMAVDAQTVVDAQRSRGLELDKGNIMKRIRNYIPILIPLIISAIRRSVELAEALESRAFGASENRTAITTLRMHRVDYAAIAATAFGIIIAIYVYFYVPLPTLIVPIKMPHLF
ncbi:MAG TPA: energy-coupling factor transporter transmembrane component T [Candidatus Saccharimonadales bacterium]|nr:energy-coupling factor transporter transmembrane component T [Candidatus Saccharimonadales bacterium]